MDIFEFAMSREKESEAFYRELAGDCPNEGLSSILIRLADSELRHQKVIEAMSSKAEPTTQDDPFLADVKSIFKTILDRKTALDFGVSQVELYRKAQGFEKDSWDMYEKAAETADSEAAKAVLNRLASQEKRHYQILDSIIEMVSRPLPGGWLESAEWYHLDEY